MKKRLLRIMLTIVLLASLLTMPAAALDIPLGACGEDLKWSYDAGTHTLTVKGSGDMTDYFYSSIPWTLMRTKLQAVVIEEGVTSIGDNAFNSCSALASVTLPDTLTRIGNHAFYGTALTAVDLPDGVTEIGNYAFGFCSKLADISLPAQLTTLGIKCFGSCNALKSVDLPDGLTAIPNEAFDGCRGLESIVIPPSVTTLGYYAFNGCEALTSVTLPAGLTEIGNGAFSGCAGLKAVTLPDTLTKLGSTAFHRSGLESIVIPASITTLKSDTFRECTALKAVTLPAELTAVNQFAFHQTPLTDVYYTGTRAQFAAITVAEGNTPLTEAVLHPSIHCDHKLTVLPAKAPTCSESGLTEGSHCEICGDDILLQQTIAPIPHPDEDGNFYCDLCDSPLCKHENTEIIPAKAATCTETGLTEGLKCNICGRTLRVQNPVPTVKHDYADGVCTMCGKTDMSTVPMENPFIDVHEGDYCYTPVLWAAYCGITGGTSKNTFSPNAPCTRAQVVTFLWRAAGEPAPASTEHSFTDISEGDYFYNAVLWAVENDITKGTGDTTFSPDAPCTRGQVVTLLRRYSGNPNPTGFANPFSDTAAGAYYYTAVLWAVEQGITTGTSSSTFSPDAPCTRGQIVTFLYRALA